MANKIRRDIDRDFALNWQQKKAGATSEKAERVVWCERCGAPVCDTLPARQAHHDKHQERDNREALREKKGRAIFSRRAP